MLFSPVHPGSILSSPQLDAEQHTTPLLEQHRAMHARRGEVVSFKTSTMTFAELMAGAQPTEGDSSPTTPPLPSPTFSSDHLLHDPRMHLFPYYCSCVESSPLSLVRCRAAYLPALGRAPRHARPPRRAALVPFVHYNFRRAHGRCRAERRRHH